MTLILYWYSSVVSVKHFKPCWRILNKCIGILAPFPPTFLALPPSPLAFCSFDHLRICRIPAYLLTLDVFSLAQSFCRLPSLPPSPFISSPLISIFHVPRIPCLPLLLHRGPRSFSTFPRFLSILRIPFAFCILSQFSRFSSSFISKLFSFCLHRSLRFEVHPRILSDLHRSSSCRCV